MPGRRDESLTIAGIDRTFVYYEPQGIDRTQPVPVVIVAHGFAMSGDMMFNITGYTQLADKEGFVALFPDGDPLSAGPWNVGDGICGLGAFVAALGDDQDFIDEMLKWIERDRPIDREHIFMTGFSMGGLVAAARSKPSLEVHEPVRQSSALTANPTRTNGTSMSSSIADWLARFLNGAAVRVAPRPAANPMCRSSIAEIPLGGVFPTAAVGACARGARRCQVPTS